jgi:hypothetical protein
MILTYLLMTICIIGVTRIISETGGYFGTASMSNTTQDWSGGWMTIGMVIPSLVTVWAAAGLTQETMMTALLVASGFTGWIWWNMIGTATLSLTAFKLADTKGTKKRDMLIAVIVGVIVTWVVKAVATVVMIQIAELVGTGGASAWGWWGEGGVAMPTALEAGNIPGTGVGWYSRFSFVTNTEPQSWVTFVSAIIIGVLIVFMRGRFSWFRISLAGVALGVLGGWDLWVPFFAGTAIKYIAVRAYGESKYNKLARPLIIGFIAGFGLFLLMYIGLSRIIMESAWSHIWS